MNLNSVVIGMQWGDEGKGKIIDFLTTFVNYVVRYQGGHNAGHTIILNGKKIILHLIPSGILHKHVTCVLGNGVVISIQDLINEINMLSKFNICIDKRLFISQSCPLVLDYHVQMDIAREKLLDEKCIGTTKKGIGPTYEDKIARFGLQVKDLYNENDLSYKLKNIIHYYNFQLVHYYCASPVSYTSILNNLLKNRDIIINKIKDIPFLLNNAHLNKKNIIFEGAQGSLLDLDHGTFPYVTSCNSSIGGVFTGTGVNLKQIHTVIGITKSYCTRVGYGPFPTELNNAINDYLCYKGKEFGSTTGRRRRTGWLDLVLLKRMVTLNSVSSLCLTKLDVLDELQEIKVCIAYKYFNTNNIIEDTVQNIDLNNVQPIYKVFKGWNTSIKGIKLFSDLPIEARNYILFIENYIGQDVKIDMISTGPNRSDTIIIRNVFNI